jgi:hypothetical protein
MKLHPFEQLERDVARDRRPKRAPMWPLVLAAFAMFSQPLQKAHAGDNFLGTITSTSPTEATNATTAVPFAIGLSQKLTVQCDAITFIATDTGTAVTALNGVKLQADQPWQTSVTGMCMWGSCTGSTVTAPNAAGKQTTSAVIRIIPAAGTSNCRVFFRNGTE